MMNKCQVCREPIWEERWPSSRDSGMKRFVCYFCFSKILFGRDYEPLVPRKNMLSVCDGCGRISESVRKTDEGLLCDECAD